MGGTPRGQRGRTTSDPKGPMYKCALSLFVQCQDPCSSARLRDDGRGLRCGPRCSAAVPGTVPHRGARRPFATKPQMASTIRTSLVLVAGLGEREVAAVLDTRQATSDAGIKAPALLAMGDFVATPTPCLPVESSTCQKRPALPPVKK